MVFTIITFMLNYFNVKLVSKGYTQTSSIHSGYSGVTFLNYCVKILLRGNFQPLKIP